MISDLSGNVRIATNDKLIGLNINDIEGFNSAINGKSYVSDIVHSVFYDSDGFGNRADELPVMYISVPVKNEDGHVIGMMMFEVARQFLIMKRKRYDMEIVTMSI